VISDDPVALEGTQNTRIARVAGRPTKQVSNVHTAAAASKGTTSSYTYTVASNTIVHKLSQKVGEDDAAHLQRNSIASKGHSMASTL